jgi:hypothetical protein
VLEISVLTHVPRQVSEQSCICVRDIGFDSCTKTGMRAVMYLCVRDIGFDSCTKTGMRAVMYLCVRGIGFDSFYDFSIGVLNCFGTGIVLFFSVKYSDFPDRIRLLC